MSSTANDFNGSTSNPFNPNYRVLVDPNNPSVANYMAELNLSSEQQAELLRKVNSAEWAEKQRPYEQFKEHLKESGIQESYDQILAYGEPANQRKSQLRALLQERAPHLLDEFEALEKLSVIRALQVGGMMGMDEQIVPKEESER